MSFDLKSCPIAAYVYTRARSYIEFLLHISTYLTLIELLAIYQPCEAFVYVILLCVVELIALNKSIFA